MKHVRHYFDYKSPYAWLAQAATQTLAAQPGVHVEWLPYTLQIDKYLGTAELDVDGVDRIGTRNDHQWRRVRYSYMDCRREANRRGLTIRGPRKIFDSSLAHIAFLYAAGHGEWWPLHKAIFERFWRRELDIEQPAVLRALLDECGLPTADFEDYLAGSGRARLRQIEAEAEAAGVFGVPSYLVDGELYWGQERLERVVEHLARKG